MVDVGHKEDQRLLGVLPQVGVLGGLDLHAHLDLGTVCMVTVWPGLTWRSVKTGSLIAW